MSSGLARGVYLFFTLVWLSSFRLRRRIDLRPRGEVGAVAKTKGAVPFVESRASSKQYQISMNVSSMMLPASRWARHRVCGWATFYPFQFDD